MDAHIISVPAPVGFYGRIAWVDDWLIVHLEPLDPNLGTAFSGRLWRFHPDGSHAEQLQLTDHPGCDRQGVEAPARLPNGRLGFIVRCFPAKDSALANLDMMAYDMHTGKTEALLPYPLPSQQIGTGGYSWNPQMTRGITSDGNGRGLSEQLYWLAPNRWDKLDVGFPQAFSAVWSPDGTQIAFFGAPEQGLSGVARADATFNLYLMNPDGTNVHPLVQNFYHVASLAWSPDGRWIVFPATFATLSKSEEGLWLIDSATGTRHLITHGHFAAPVWSPDGKRLAAIQYSGEYPNQQQQIVILEFDPLLGNK